jgi:phenylpropionate dioxygenase-like ring-hydroxylating dioxygenase large terminal subunit
MAPYGWLDSANTVICQSEAILQIRPAFEKETFSVSQNKPEKTEWFHVGDVDMLAVGRITTVQVGHTTVCLIRAELGYGAINNRCPIRVAH